MVFHLKVKETLRMIYFNLLTQQIKKGSCPRSQDISAQRMGDTGLHLQGEPLIHSISIY